MFWIKPELRFLGALCISGRRKVHVDGLVSLPPTSGVDNAALDSAHRGEALSASCEDGGLTSNAATVSGDYAWQ